MTTINVSTAKTAELVAFYNAHAAKPVSKFADRKTAERRVSELLATLPAPKAEKTLSAAPKAKVDKVAGQRAAAIAKSWKDASVAAARATRHAVQVTTPDSGKKEFKSVREAFLQLSLPLGRHIKFRGQLKATGKAEIQGCKFRLA